MLTYPDIDPVAVAIGPLKIHWYGLMYLLAFASAWGLANYRARRPGSGWTPEQVSDLIFYGAMGVILGGRCGYVLLYNFPQFLQDPLWLLRVWEGGMSFHGGLLGVMAALAWFGHKYQKNFFDVADFVAPLVPVGLMFGRFGNFIGGELWGRVADPAHVPWAMVFPRAGELPRHPSQLYQAALEGFLLFVILWFYSSRPRPQKAVSAMFLIGYGLFRTIAEFFREPDAHIGFDLFGWMSRGQLLSLPMIVIGIILLVIAYRSPKSGEQKV
ncbi:MULTISPECIES: prolipoprotein diacylglyceryl transferase [Oceanospirillaceae]|jgi:phosphatidylglycerol:prolipoprotein diacylglycerol transferase|uniref:prolipoprotein diacylglyceryl transferase n=1 Tax=Oceanospirillaceae TaxID=135620 RepID=UPI000C5DB2D4|nr:MULTISPECIES: prolipoprotein diacylglyceryl transferase [Thalassolituus]MAY15422.1 prolipoprotein diacylglyceryl transferase [Oceanospirillaceae bacterium]PIQ39854.1 MAG: prolipoprotein diacylglyceryl transferase [Thalassolituus sp. CG17_big_fil_post_rev_8_21_14_2_50_53_8]MCA6059193.1 prolipoprotein diacylglyceryl transferase [Thalassolituus sp. ST750PaO-4]MCB2386516.1 prolipoprotein diacylglyceryl transferase [Thalassolituus alkanivorans]MCB2422999.1 prolipoprotein diacylglyceryl transfera